MAITCGRELFGIVTERALRRTRTAGSGGAGNGAIGLSLRGVLDRASLTARAIGVAILGSYTLGNGF